MRGVMFLRHTKRKKDGKEHRYWSIVENRRVGGGRVVQRPLLYLGEINDSQELAWRKSIAVLEEGAAAPRPLSLFPEDRCEGVLPDAAVVRLLSCGCAGRGSGAGAGWREPVARSGARIANGSRAAPWPTCWARMSDWRRSTSSTAVTMGCSNTNKRCSTIWSGVGATCSTFRSTSCSTT